ncbi:MAG: hypothetical protein GWP09_01865, partial [Nitrospiraceae bacterium]|nr:hypothetical protein [Nitrospiraceae bacterium]
MVSLEKSMKIIKYELGSFTDIVKELTSGDFYNFERNDRLPKEALHYLKSNKWSETYLNAAYKTGLLKKLSEVYYDIFEDPLTLSDIENDNYRTIETLVNQIGGGKEIKEKVDNLKGLIDYGDNLKNILDLDSKVVMNENQLEHVDDLTKHLYEIRSRIKNDKELENAAKYHLVSYLFATIMKDDEKTNEDIKALREYAVAKKLLLNKKIEDNSEFDGNVVVNLTPEMIEKHTKESGQLSEGYNWFLETDTYKIIKNDVVDKVASVFDERQKIIDEMKQQGTLIPYFAREYSKDTSIGKIARAAEHFKNFIELFSDGTEGENTYERASKIYISFLNTGEYDSKDNEFAELNRELR